MRSLGKSLRKVYNFWHMIGFKRQTSFHFNFFIHFQPSELTYQILMIVFSLNDY